MTKILVVDDEKDVCDFVQNFFQERGCTVFCALSGFHALDIVNKEKPDLILLDVRMREMDGLETLRKIRKADKDVKVFMVTAADEQDKIDTARELGVSKYLTKPLDLSDLEKAVRACSKKG